MAQRQHFQSHFDAADKPATMPLHLPVPLGDAAFKQLVQMQASMPAVDPPRMPASAPAAEEQQEAELMARLNRAAAVQRVLDAEEDNLVGEARNVGMPWPDIAALVPTRSLVDIRKRFNARAAAQAAAARQAEYARMLAMRQAAQIEDAVQRPASGSGGARPWRKLVGDERVKLKRLLDEAPTSFSGMRAHKLKDLSGVSFYGAADVLDPDQEDGIGETYTFDMQDPAHGACFNLGEDAEGNTLISWSQLHVIYVLPDGSSWAEHSDFVDASDVEDMARKQVKRASAVLPADRHPRELFRKVGRHHSRLRDIEYQCWVFDGGLPDPLPETISPSDAFFWRTCFDPERFEIVETLETS